MPEDHKPYIDPETGLPAVHGGADADFEEADFEASDFETLQPITDAPETLRVVQSPLRWGA